MVVLGADDVERVANACVTYSLEVQQPSSGGAQCARPGSLGGAGESSAGIHLFVAQPSGSSREGPLGAVDKAVDRFPRKS